jgi:hypothetical protein
MKLKRIEKIEDYLGLKGILAVEAIKARVLKDIYINPLNIILFFYIINFNLFILFSFIIINKSSKESIRYN